MGWNQWDTTNLSSFEAVYLRYFVIGRRRNWLTLSPALKMLLPSLRQDSSFLSFKEDKCPHFKIRSELADILKRGELVLNTWGLWRRKQTMVWCCPLGSGVPLRSWPPGLPRSLFKVIFSESVILWSKYTQGVNYCSQMLFRKNTLIEARTKAEYEMLQSGQQKTTLRVDTALPHHGSPGGLWRSLCTEANATPRSKQSAR